MSLLRQRGRTKRVGRFTLSAVARAQADALLGESIEMATRIYKAREADRHGAKEERERCLRICRQYPDNLMAREITNQIESGFYPVARLQEHFQEALQGLPLHPVEVHHLDDHAKQYLHGSEWHRNTKTSYGRVWMRPGWHTSRPAAKGTEWL